MAAKAYGDRDAIVEVLVRYATGIDSRDWQLFTTCFTDDCDADYGAIGHWHGAAEITEWMAKAHDPLGPTMHQVGNFTVHINGDWATARTYVHGVITMQDRSLTVHAYGWYDDELTTTPDGWQIARRRFTEVTTETHPRQT